MDKKVLIVGVVLTVIQMTRAQPPNLAALLGLEGFGNLFGNMGGGGGGGRMYLLFYLDVVIVLQNFTSIYS
jgi:hypothetical protein